MTKHSRFTRPASPRWRSSFSVLTSFDISHWELVLCVHEDAILLQLHSLAQRRRRPEVMDRGDLAPERHFQALRGLERINRWSGSARILGRPILAHARNHSEQPCRLLDVATGGGDIPIKLWHRARRAGLKLEVAGCDKSPRAVEYARRYAAECQADAHFFEWDVVENGLPGPYDIVTSSLFLHHLDEEQAITLIQAMARAAQGLLLINDLVRSRAGYALAYWGTRILSASDVVHGDGPLSVEGAFTPKELAALARQAGLDDARITSRWPCRMLLEWERS
jgi:2-polyprenyl-3-methyl-5-hydroxy-6-metoxy-1,4-benzoquinol methylase